LKSIRRIPHAKRVFGALEGNFRRQIRIALGLKARPKAPVLSQPLDQIIERHAWLCRCLDEHWPEGFDIRGQRVCEVGAGDCLAAVSRMLARGAAHVLVVEKEPPVVNDKQRAVFTGLAQRGVPMRLELIVPGDPPKLDHALMAYHTEYMENYHGLPEHALVYSLCVLEHVEDLDLFFRSCRAALKPGGRMFHYIDLGGHGQFEDPMPPLEFQRYSEWLYGRMFPPYYRATRRFVRDYCAAAERAGFVDVRARPVRRAEPAYVNEIQPDLRATARAIPPEELGVIEFLLEAVNPPEAP
jgi:SAM-dependent methyltransferase